MNDPLLCAALVAGAAGLLVRPCRGEQRVRALLAADGSHSSRMTDGTSSGGTEVVVGHVERAAGLALLRRGLRGPGAASGLAGLAVALVVGGWTGVLLALLVTAVAFRVISRLEPGDVRRRRLRIAGDMPLAVDLLVVCLAAGRPISSAAGVVGEAVGGPLAQELRRIGARIELGGDPVSVWSEAGRDTALGPLARALVRALETGSPPAASLSLLADDLRRDRRAMAEETARRVAVRSAGPLGLCFLPAFVLVGVVPTLIGAFGAVLQP
ncbi:MAG TPA: type II secretion system F family protein [Nocardioidaceae bacterium]|nr:type II secretion system F family protein [Nocardioidaceae bacterium]